jgi:predicted nucleic acid-binding protein
MTKYLLDTNVVLRFCNPSDRQHSLATDSISYLLTQGDECFLTAQVLVELWVVATRPVEVNGLGWAVNTVRISPKTCKLTNVPLDDFVAHADATVFVEFS